MTRHVNILNWCEVCVNICVEEYQDRNKQRDNIGRWVRLCNEHLYIIHCRCAYIHITQYLQLNMM